MTASAPIIRYYDHLRLVYEVESRMRELRRDTDRAKAGTDDQHSRSRCNPAAPGESKQNAATRTGVAHGSSATVRQPGDWAGCQRFK